MITAAVVVDGMVQVTEGNRSEHVCVVIEMSIEIAFDCCNTRFTYGRA